MKIDRRSLLVAAVGALASTAQAQEAWPSKPIRIVVPFAAGGTSDALARLLGQKLQEALKQTVIVENKAGAGGVIGADVVAKAAPDGYTLLLGTIASNAINPALQPKMPYDAAKDFVPVFFIGNIANVLIVGASQPYKSVKELIAAAKAKPGTIAYGTPGSGSSQHLSGVKFGLDAGVELVHIPYKGSGPSMQDLLAGQIPMSFETALTALPQINAGKVRALAVTPAKRAKVLPEVPTLAESGLKGFDVASWQALFAPAGTPPAIVKRLNEELTRIVAETQVAARLYTMGVENVPMTPAQFADFQRAEQAKWVKIVKDGNVKPE
ncbi:MAG TPA: tripartite tricarboxylate transporter substrate binding protein [Burkholderiaceae bacterium]|nr:tripartite tricarboxylate transporter substrate binding protein [Burkholderiaceae bacterium]